MVTQREEKMFAVVKTGGKQYRVSADSVLKVEKLLAKQGDSVELTEVLMVSDGEKLTIGDPLVAGAKVRAVVLEQIRAPKIVVFKKKRRHNYRRKNGHRQMLSVLRVKEIVAA